ncbi:MAG: CoB--CoM heterodisulfide reductase iron-sulfur subunit B family protein [Clostridia bacterium]|nr:CoB--CoM heterodisulfide reductase iron-sulfur subunit B family protein [Clostridia bacterium]
MKYAYYPGCSLHATGLEYHLSTLAVARHLGLELEELPDWNCCGASAAHNTNRLLALALPARNLALAEQRGLDMAVPCAACFNRLRAAVHAVRTSAQVREEVADLIRMDYQGRREVYSLLELIANHVGEERIREKVVRPLTGLKAACYYGCLLVRPPEITGFDDPEDPQSMDRLLLALGAEAVPWSHKTECCGAAHSTTRPDLACHLLNGIYAGARAAGAACLVVACPLCFLNLDMRQAEVEKRFGTVYRLPVFYFTELVGFALGSSPGELGLPKHFVRAEALLASMDAAR